MSLDASFPPTRAFAREILPGVRETPATVDAAFPWIAQTRALLSPNELQGLLDAAPAGDGRPRRAHEQLDQVLAAARRGRPLLLEHDHSGRQHRREGRGAHEPPARRQHRRELQGVLGGDGRAQPARARALTATAATSAARSVAGHSSSSSARRSSSAACSLATPTFQPLGTSPIYPTKQPPVNPTLPVLPPALCRT